jgi:hypothetical protein
MVFERPPGGVKNPFWTALLTRFSRVYVEGYTAPSKIGSLLAKTVFERRRPLKNPFWTALLTRFPRVYVDGYTAPSKIGSLLARTVFERPPGEC